MPRCNVTAVSTFVCTLCLETRDIAVKLPPYNLTRPYDDDGKLIRPKRDARRGVDRRRLICTDCRDLPRKISVDRTLRYSCTRYDWSTWELHPCVTCGLQIWLPPRWRRIVACSQTCRVASYRRPVQVAVTHCEGCGGDMTGRSDRRYCSSACRQRAYRLRSARARGPEVVGAGRASAPTGGHHGQPSQHE